MSIANPTALRVGAQGHLEGRHWRVAGRVVLSMQADDGETYYWNEFNLASGFGHAATLVHEEGESGPEWKFFTVFEPLRALTVTEAAAKRVGDTVNLDGRPARITLVDQSRVQHIEGVGPEGVEVGDVANYFNVDTGPRMLVVSWTGDELEVYEGRDLPAAQLQQAFKLSAAPPPLPLKSAARESRSRRPLTIVGLALLVISLVGVYSCSTGRKVSQATSVPPTKHAAPAVRLQPGASGALGQTRYTIQARARVEIARVGARHDRHEYSLIGDANQRVFLINGLTGDPKEWHLFVPFDAPGPLAALTPFEAATRRRGAPVPLPGRTLRIVELFQSRALTSERGDALSTGPSVHYGFLAREADDWLLAQWTEGGIQFHRGVPLAENVVLGAFALGPGKAR